MLMIAVSGCSRNLSGNVNNSSWKLVAYHDQKSGVVDSEPSDIRRSIEINFGEISKWSGHTVTNKVSGNFEISENNQIRISDFRGTKMGEPNWGRMFWEAFPDVTSYKLEKKKLFLFYDDGKKFLEFVRMD